jgi:hypothetical protein
MSHHAGQSQQAAFSALAPQVRAALGQLLRAFDYARDLDCSLWDFSVEIDRLLTHGMTTSDLRWLIKRGYLSHARETTGPDDEDRRFDTTCRNLAFFPNSCFVLTASGLTIMGRSADNERSVSNCLLKDRSREEFSDRGITLAGSEERGEPTQSDHGSTSIPPLRLRYATYKDTSVIPNWDREARTFMVGDFLVKRFRVPSPNQEAVLEAFQEEGWPRTVDDPLSPMPDQQPKRRLRDTIKCLNMNQANQVIRFRGDGTGQRVSWELLIDAAGAPVSGASKAARRAA